MRMNLRQIVRNQKLQSFDLISLISEEFYINVFEKGKQKKNAAGDGYYWYRTSSGDLRPSTHDNAKKQGYSAVNPDDKDADKIPKDQRPKVDDMPQQKTTDTDTSDDQDTQSTDGDSEKDFDDELDDFMGTDDESDDEERSERPNLDDIRGKAFPEEGQSISYGMEEQTGDPSDENWPNDAIAKQTSWETGHNKGTPAALKQSKTTRRGIEAAPGDAGSLFNELGSNEIADLLQKISPEGDDLSDEELAQILHDQFGKTHAAKQNGSGSKDKKVQNTYEKKLLIAAQAGRRKNNRVKKALENAQNDGFDADNISNAETLYGSADSLEAARQQVRKATGFYGQEGKVTEVPSDERTKDEFAESIGDTQLAAARKVYKSKVVKSREDLEKLDLPFPSDLIELSKGESGKIVGINEEKMNEYINNLFPEDFDSLSEEEKSEKIKNFMEALVLSAGGGNNPADTTTVVTDNDGNLIVLQHSDKADLKAQLANSTPNKEIVRSQEELKRMESNGDIDDKNLKKATEINEKTQREIKEEEGKLSDVKREGLKKLAEFAENPKQAAMIIKLVDESVNSKDSTLKPKFYEIIDKMEGNSPEEKFQNFAKMLADPNTKVTGPQNRIIEKIRNQMVLNPDAVKKDGKPWGAYQLDSSQQQAEIRKSVVKIIQDRVANLNKLKDGQGRALGNILETRKLIDLLHLYQMDEPSRGAYVQGITETVAGADGVTAENLKRCLGVENTEELLDKVKVGPPVIPEGEGYVADDELGVPEAFLTRDIKAPEVDEEGSELYWKYDDEGRRIGKTTDKNDVGGTGKAVPVGTVTAQKSVVYYEDKDGKRFEIAGSSSRAKGGPQSPLGTGYAWSPDMQQCLGEEDDKTNEDINLLGSILAEEKTNTLSYHWKIAEDDYPVDLFIKELNERSLN